MDVSKRIIELRKQKKYSTTKLAKISGIGQTTLNDIERKIKQPNLSTLEQICKGLDITLADFFSDSYKSPLPLEYTMEDLIESAKHLSPKQLGVFVKVFQWMKTEK